MKTLKSPMVNALYTAILSTIYGLLFFFIGVYLPNSIIAESASINISRIITDITISYLGLFVFIIGIIIDILQAKRVTYYDEYQLENLTKYLIIFSFFNILILPICLFINIFQINCGLLLLICILFFHWLLVVTIQLILYIKNYK